MFSEYKVFYLIEYMNNIHRTLIIREKSLQSFTNISKHCLFDPYNKFCTSWSLFMIFFDICYTLITLPIVVSFSVFEFWNFWMIFDLMICCALLMNLFVNLTTGYIIIIENKSLVTKVPSTCWYLYVTKGTCVIDVVSVVPLFVTIIICFALDAYYPTVITIFSAIRFVRIVTIFRLCKDGVFTNIVFAISKIPLNIYTSKGVIALYITYLSFFVINVLTCLWFGIARVQGYIGTWIDHADLNYVPCFENYVTSMFFVVTTLTTVGYGDIIATNVVERIAAIVIMLTGVGFFLVLIGLMSDVFMTFGFVRSTEKVVECISGLNILLKMDNINDEIKNKVKQHHRNFILRKQVDSYSWYKVFSQLPAQLKLCVLEAITEHTFTSIEKLNQIPKEQQLIILSNLQYIETHEYGEELFHKGKAFNDIFIVIQGKVLMIDGEDEELQAPCIFDRDFSHNGLYSKTVLLLDKCIVFKIDANLYEQILHEFGI